MAELDSVARLAAALEDAQRHVDELRRERDAAIGAAFVDEHASVTTIAAAAGLTRARVSAILGHPHRRPGRPARRPPDDGRSG